MFTALELLPKRYFLHGIPYLQLCCETQLQLCFFFIGFPLYVQPNQSLNELAKLHGGQYDGLTPSKYNGERTWDESNN